MFVFVYEENLLFCFSFQRKSDGNLSRKNKRFGTPSHVDSRVKK